MPRVVGVAVARILAAVVGSGASDATLTRTTPGARTAGDETSGTNPTSDDYGCKGYVRDYDDGAFGEGIRVGDRKITLYGDTIRDEAGDLVVPRAKDRVTIAEEDHPAETYHVISVKRGTAGARYILQGRK